MRDCEYEHCKKCWVKNKSDGFCQFSSCPCHSPIEKEKLASLGIGVGVGGAYLGKLADAHYKKIDALGREQWRIVAHRFYDLILTGRDTTKFWEDLLK